MITEQSTYHCRKCQSTNVRRNGYNKANSALYHCRDCNFYGVMYPKVAYTEEQKEQIINVYNERASMRGIQRVYGVAPATLASWIKKKVSTSKLEDDLLPAHPNDTIELDEMWTFVKQRINKQWLWLALCRRTRQIIGYYIGKRDENACRQFKDNIVHQYQHALTKSDMWHAYAKVFTSDSHESSEYRGETNHIERCNATIRARVGRLIRKCLSFSKCPDMHEAAIRLFVMKYNQEKAIWYSKLTV